MKAKKPLEVVGWLSSAGYQTVIIKSAKSSSARPTKKLVRARPTAKKKASP